MADEMTTGEISRNLARLSESMTRIEDKLDQRPSWKDVDRVEAALKTADADQEKDIQTLQAALTGAMRLVVTSLVGVVLSLLGAVISLLAR